MKKLTKSVLALTLAVLTLCTTSFSAFAEGVSRFKNDYTYVSLNQPYETEYHSSDNKKWIDSPTIKGETLYADAYVFYVPANGRITISLTSDEKNNLIGDSSRHSIYRDSNLNKYVWFNHSSGVTPVIKKNSTSWNINLSKGKYYYIIENNQNVYVDFILKISYKPTFSNTALNSVKAKKKAFSVNMKKANNASGYQIQYATNSKMKSAKKVNVKGNKNTSKTISNLKGKRKYYVRVRSYKTVKVNGVNKTYYGKWTAKKAVKTK